MHLLLLAMHLILLENRVFSRSSDHLENILCLHNPTYPATPFSCDSVRSHLGVFGQLSKSPHAICLSAERDAHRFGGSQSELLLSRDIIQSQSDRLKGIRCFHSSVHVVRGHGWHCLVQPPFLETIHINPHTSNPRELTDI